MNSVTIKGTYSAGYTLGATVTNLTIATGAYVGPSGGVYSGHVATVVNYGRVFNYSTVANSGIGVDMAAGGVLTNGSDSKHHVIYGKVSGVSFGAGAATLVNFGKISGGSAFGAYLEQGGTVTNGSITDTTALISGSIGVGVQNLAAIVANYGTIIGDSKIAVNFQGGTVTNGSNTDTTALISGHQGVISQSHSATIKNYGTIAGYSNYTNTYSVGIYSGGKVINGSNEDTTALISGFNVVLAQNAAATVANYGTILGTGHGGSGVHLLSGGAVINGSTTDTTALIDCSNIGVLAIGAVQLNNFGTISDYDNLGVYLRSGMVTNGSTTDSTALISGGNGLYASGYGQSSATVTNYGTIQGLRGPAVLFKSANDRLIAESNSTFVGSVLGGGGMLELAGGTGTIMGLGGAGTISGTEAMNFNGFGAYQLDAGSNWTLSGTNVLKAGVTLTDAGMVNQEASLIVGSGSSASILAISSGGTWTINGAVGIESGGSATSMVRVVGELVKSGASGTSIIQLATLDLGMIEVATGKLDFKRTMSGSGALRVDAGATLELDSSARRTLLMVFGGASATLALKAPTKFAATISGFAVSDTIDLLKIIATGARINAKDQLVIVDGTTTVATLKLTGSYSGATFSIVSDGHGGTNVTLLTASSVPPPFGTPHAFVAAMAELGGGGSGSSVLQASPAVSLNAMRLLTPGGH